MWQLTGGAVHATDVSNASRTLMLNVHTNTWDEELLKLLDVPVAVLPAVFPSSHVYGHTKAELLGASRCRSAAWPATSRRAVRRACFRSGLAKNTYGTGCFMLMHTGSQFQTSANGLITTSAAQPAGMPPEFAFEGSVFIGGAVVQWLRDGLHAIRASGECSSSRRACPTGGVLFVPAFTGLGAPYWKPGRAAPSSG